MIGSIYRHRARMAMMHALAKMVREAEPMGQIAHSHTFDLSGSTKAITERYEGLLGQIRTLGLRDGLHSRSPFLFRRIGEGACRILATTRELIRGLL